MTVSRVDYDKYLVKLSAARSRIVYDIGNASADLVDHFARNLYGRLGCILHKMKRARVSCRSSSTHGEKPFFTIGIRRFVRNNVLTTF